jgi:hypothetical protein
MIGMDGVMITGLYGLLRGKISLLLLGSGKQPIFEYCACCGHSIFPNIILGIIHFAAVERNAFMKQEQGTADARKIFCYLAHAAGFPTLDIGNFLGIQQAAVSHASRKGASLAEKLSIKIGGEDSIV